MMILCVVEIHEPCRSQWQRQAKASSLNDSKNENGFAVSVTLCLRCINNHYKWFWALSFQFHVTQIKWLWN